MMYASASCGIGFEALEPRRLLSTFTVTSVADSGAGTLRQAILNANAHAGADTINFHIGSGGVKSIRPLSALPALTDPVTISGTTQGGYHGSPLIELNGSSAGTANGLTLRTDNSTIRGLVINRFNGSGIAMQSANHDHIEGCFIGADTSGTRALGNATGILLGNAGDNVIGGTRFGAGNLISGNTGHGIFFNGGHRTLVQGNRIGTDVTGRRDLGNGGAGLRLVFDSFDNQIGGTSAAARNIISGNAMGVSIAEDPSGNRIQGNYIGTGILGQGDLGNHGPGVYINSANRNTIGGTASGAGNLISGNDAQGILILNLSATTIQGNRIGTNAGGTARVANSADGILIRFTSGCVVGGTAPGAGNLISGNTGDGIHIIGDFDLGPASNRIQGNRIGTNITGNGALGNGGAGVLIDGAFNNTIGGSTAAAGNRIAFNTGPGVWITRSSTSVHTPAGTGNLVRRNSIFSNRGIGIDLGPLGVTPNDRGDSDTGPNNLQNFPVLNAAASRFGTTFIRGSINSNPNKTLLIDFYATPASGGTRQGARYLGSTTVRTNGGGNASFRVRFAVSVPTGQLITATATAPTGNDHGDTSEFSAPVPVRFGRVA